MLCEICGENEATFHYSEVVNGNKTEHHLCSECAAKTDISYYTNLPVSYTHLTLPTKLVV